MRELSTALIASFQRTWCSRGRNTRVAAMTGFGFLVLSILDGHIDRRTIEAYIEHTLVSSCLFHEPWTFRVEACIDRRAFRMPSTAVTVVSLLAAPPTQSHYIFGRRPTCLSSKPNMFSATRLPALPTQRRASPPSKCRKHLRTSAISAPELGTPDAIVGTVCNTRSLSCRMCLLPRPGRGTAAVALQRSGLI